MKFEPATIKDIARALGLSTSTVSRALRGSYEISSDTKKLVLEHAEKINYRPNPIALSLKERRSRAIGVVVCEIANSFFSQVINGIESIAYNRGYHVIISQSHESYEREVVNVEHLASRSVDGLLVSISNETTNINHFTQLYDKGLPIVFFDRVTEAIQTHKVKADNFKGAYQATEHLIKNGYHRIAHLSNAPTLSITQERLDGYKAALAANGIAYDAALVQYCYHGGMIQEEITLALKELLLLNPKPDGMLTASGRITNCCLIELKDAGLQIPEDMAVVGFSNTTMPDLFNPSLTTIRQPAFEIGQVGIELLIQMIESKRPVTNFETRILAIELVERASSRKR